MNVELFGNSDAGTEKVVGRQDRLRFLRHNAEVVEPEGYTCTDQENFNLLVEAQVHVLLRFTH